jgi:hypothetical protein
MRLRHQKIEIEDTLKNRIVLIDAVVNILIHFKMKLKSQRNFNIYLITSQDVKSSKINFRNYNMNPTRSAIDKKFL